MPGQKYNLKSRRAKIRSNFSKTYKATEYASRKANQERKRQLLIAGGIVRRQIQHLIAEGVLPEHPVAAAGAGARNDMVIPEFNLDQANLIMNNAAGEAINPLPLRNEIRRQVQEVNRRGEGHCVRYSRYALIQIFMHLAAIYYAQFPIHAAPHEMSVFDALAGHLSTAGTAVSAASYAGPYVGLLPGSPIMTLANSGTLASCALGVKLLGHAVRNYNATTGRFVPNTPAEAARRRLDLMEFTPNVGMVLPVVRAVETVGELAAKKAMGRPIAFSNAKKFKRSAANVAVNVGRHLGIPENVALSTAEEGVKAIAPFV